MEAPRESLRVDGNYNQSYIRAYMRSQEELDAMPDAPEEILRNTCPPDTIYITQEAPKVSIGDINIKTTKSFSVKWSEDHLSICIENLDGTFKTISCDGDEVSFTI